MEFDCTCSCSLPFCLLRKGIKPDRQIFKIFGIKPKVFMRIIILSDLFESRVALNPGIGDVMGVENTCHCLV